MRAASSSVLLRRGVIAARTKLAQPLTTTDMICGSGTCAGGYGIEASIAASPQTILRGTLATFRRHASSTLARRLSAQRGASDAPASGVDPARHPELGERWGWSDAAHRYYYPLKALGVFSEKSTNALTSGRMLQTCLNNAERKEWYTLGKISNEFLPKLLWLSTNIWLLSRRLLREGERGKRVQELLFDELWREARRQMRSIEVDEMMLKKYLGEAQQHTFLTLVQYDHAYTLENRDERMEILMAALWRGIFMGNEAIKDHHVRVIAEYMDRELADVYEIDAEDFFAVCIEFAPPPPFDLGATRQLTDKESLQGKPKSPAAGASSVNLARGRPVERIQHGDFGDTGDGRWRASLAESGKVYYWHTATRETVWEKPPDSDPFVPSIMPKVVE